VAGRLLCPYVANRVGTVIPGTSGSVGPHYLHSDPLGTVQAVTDNIGARQATYAYEPFGTARPSPTNQADVDNRPTVLTDPSGQCWFCGPVIRGVVTWAMAGGIANAGIQTTLSIETRRRRPHLASPRQVLPHRRTRRSSQLRRPPLLSRARKPGKQVRQSDAHVVGDRAVQHTTGADRAWRKAIPYSAGTRTASRAQIEAARRIYADYPEILKALGL